ncbi:MAG: primosomal protein N' [Candidatus Puniceispirillaceae bacterium]
MSVTGVNETENDSVSVALATPLLAAYDYHVGGFGPLARGTIVLVPLGRNFVHGIILGPGSDDVPRHKLRPIKSVPRLAPLVPRFVDFLEKMSAWTLAPLGSVVKMVLSQPDALLPPPLQTIYRPVTPQPDVARPTKARERVLDLLQQAGGLSAAEIRKSAGVSASVITTMAKQGLLEAAKIHPSTTVAHPDLELAGPELTADQRYAASVMSGSIGAGFNAFLLDGVTGSGKTETYLEAVRSALAAGQQVLILLPEIALSTSWRNRFRARFGVPPTEWHSDIGPASKRRAWRAIQKGEAQVVVGARSALFLPFADLGLIIVDEEHEHAFKQEDQVIYQARDMAVLRASQEACPIILASATPSLESWVNAGMTGEKQRYRRLVLPNRVMAAALPEISAIDLRATPPERGRWLAPPLIEALQARLDAGEQSLLFLNRRGYAPLTLCGACGHQLACPNCDSWMVAHRLAGRLRCHHCGYETRPPDECSACGESDSMRACGPGVERLAEEVLHRFPEARFAVLSSDTVGSPKASEMFVQSVIDGDVDIIIGTQMAAKGHHFPNLTLVGVVDADLGLAGGDLRAAERTFQMLMQVAGRAGRESRPGAAILQTLQPENPVISALLDGDRDQFLAHEVAARQAAGMPPFARLASIVLSAPDQERLHAAADTLARAVPRFEGVDIFGPTAAPLSFLRGRHRARMLIRAEKSVDIQQVVKSWTQDVKLPTSVRLYIDIDPYSFL